MRSKAFVKRGARPGVTTVVCAGDSITHGIGCGNYVKQLEARLGGKGFDFVNAGYAGDLACSLWLRLDEVIVCRPDVVTVLIGTNDLAAHINDNWMRGYVKQHRPPKPLTLDYYRRMLTNIVRRLQAETTARIALIELPLLTEDPDNEINQLGNRYNEVVHEVADSVGLPVLPLRQAMIAGLPVGHVAPTFDGSKKLTASSAARGLLLRQSYNSISDRYGFQFMTDHIHLNERGAGLIAEEVTRFLSA